MTSSGRQIALFETCQISPMSPTILSETGCALIMSMKVPRMHLSNYCCTANPLGATFIAK